MKQSEPQSVERTGAEFVVHLVAERRGCLGKSASAFALVFFLILETASSGAGRFIVGEVQLRLIVFCSFDDGVDDVSLAAERDLFAHKVPDVLCALVCGAAGDDGRSAGGQFVDYAGVEVSIEGQGERARDGRRRHHEHVGLAAYAFCVRVSHQLEALLHAEAVLLVDDDEAEVLEVDLVLDEGVRADGQIRFAAIDSAPGLALGGFVERTGQQRYAIGLSGSGRDCVCRAAFGR